MNKKKIVHIGTFGQPQGLKGEIKIIMFVSSFESFKRLQQYLREDGETEWHFVKFRNVGNKLIAILEDCQDRDAALALKGKKIYSLRKNFPKTKNKEYYVIDLIGSEVKNIANQNLGIVVNIQNFGASDLLEVENNFQKKYYIPMDDDNVMNVDTRNKIIIVNPMLGILE